MSKQKFGVPKLETLRKRAGVTQKVLAESLEITDHTYRNWLTGRSQPSLSIRQFKALCRVLRCSPEELPDDPTELEELAKASETQGPYKTNGGTA